MKTLKAQALLCSPAHLSTILQGTQGDSSREEALVETKYNYSSTVPKYNEVLVLYLSNHFYATSYFIFLHYTSDENKFLLYCSTFI